MPNINLPNINISENDLKSEETMKQLVDTLFKYKKELNYLLSNLDADNMPAVIKRVSNTEESLDGLSTRVSAAELSITPEAITTTVESNTTELAKKSDIPDPVDTSLLATKSEVAQTATSVILNFTELQNMLGEDVVIESGNIRLSKDGILVTHSSFPGQYSDFRANGVVRGYPNGEAAYLNGIHVIYVENFIRGSENRTPYIYVDLPLHFKGRGSDIEIVIIPGAMRWETGNLRARDDITWLTEESESYIRHNLSLSNLNATPPYIAVRAEVQEEWEHRSDGLGMWYHGMDFVVLVIGR